VRAPDGDFYEQKIIVDVQTGKRILAEGVTQSLTTYLLSDKLVQTYRFPSSTCESGKEDGVILGQRVLLREIRAPSPNDRVVQSWYAPDLGCILLKDVLKKVNVDGTVSILFQKEATQITFGEPDPSLFVVPSWTERSPSEVSAEVKRRFGVTESTMVKDARDRAYHAQQVRRP
jgi:hypothetical protein